MMKFLSFKECRDFIWADAYRYTGNYKWSSFMRLYFVTIGFRYTVWMRLCTYLMTRKSLIFLYYLSLFRLKHLSYKSGIQISWKTKIGKGFYIGHFGTIVVSPLAVLGENVNVSQGCCIGAANRGRRKGAATIGSSVYLGPGSKIVGSVSIGNNVCIGANAVVTEDLPDGAVGGGIPCKILSFKGSEFYVNNKV